METKRIHTMRTNKEKANWLTGLLTGWGIKESWAKIIAGAVIGALAAAGILTQTGCGTAANVSLSSEQGMLSVSMSEDGKVIVSTVPPVVQQKGK